MDSHERCETCNRRRAEAALADVERWNYEVDTPLRPAHEIGGRPAAAADRETAALRRTTLEDFAAAEFHDEAFEEQDDHEALGPVDEEWEEDETFYQEYEHAFDGEAGELLDEISRTSPGYVQWVQQSLNRVMSAGLAVDGKTGPRTREAVRRFQRISGLTEDGIAGVQVERALLAAGAPPPPDAGSAGGPSAPAAPTPSAGSPGPTRKTAVIRRDWAAHQCADGRMRRISVLGTRTPVNALTVDAFGALDRVLRAAGYEADRAWSYVCRKVRDSQQMSLHAYGLALDIDPPLNPHRRGQPGPARFSTGATKADRARDVRNRVADTVFTPAQIKAVEAIRTVDGLRVFNWGGWWRSNPDAMHFQINVSPAELSRGIAPVET